jgi:transposase
MTYGKSSTRSGTSTHRHRLALPAARPTTRADGLRLRHRLDHRRPLHPAQLRPDRPGRSQAGRPAEPSAGVIDTQSVKTSPNAPTATQGTDAGKRIIGRKRGIVTDTLGLLLAVLVTAAGASDHTIGVALLDRAKATHHTLAKTWVDAGFTTTVVEHGAGLGIDVEVVTKDPQATGFSVIKRRWVIERTFGWIMRHRRLARDYETLLDTAAAMTRIAMIDNAARRVTDESTSLRPSWPSSLRPQHHSVRSLWIPQLCPLFMSTGMPLPVLTSTQVAVPACHGLVLGLVVLPRPRLAVVLSPQPYSGPSVKLAAAVNDELGLVLDPVKAALLTGRLRITVATTAMTVAAATDAGRRMPTPLPFP